VDEFRTLFEVDLVAVAVLLLLVIIIVAGVVIGFRRR